jgi:hypothetical protein
VLEAYPREAPVLRSQQHRFHAVASLHAPAAAHKSASRLGSALVKVRLRTASGKWPASRSGGVTPVGSQPHGRCSGQEGWPGRAGGHGPHPW